MKYVKFILIILDNLKTALATENIDDILRCRNKDEHTNDPVSIYQGDCKLNNYFNALSAPTSLETAVDILAIIDESLSVQLAIRIVRIL